jgi:hypothetical protein
MLDYRKAFWKPDGFKAWFAVDWVFLFPSATQHGPLASVMSQNRVGTVDINTGGGLTFMTAAHMLARTSTDGCHEIRPGSNAIGRKVGSR